MNGVAPGPCLQAGGRGGGWKEGPCIGATSRAWQESPWREGRRREGARSCSGSRRETERGRGPSATRPLPCRQHKTPCHGGDFVHPARLLYSSSPVSSTHGIWHCTRMVSKALGPLKIGSTNIGLRLEQGCWRLGVACGAGVGGNSSARGQGCLLDLISEQTFPGQGRMAPDPARARLPAAVPTVRPCTTPHRTCVQHSQ